MTMHPRNKQYNSRPNSISVGATSSTGTKGRAPTNRVVLMKRGNDAAVEHYDGRGDGADANGASLYESKQRYTQLKHSNGRNESINVNAEDEFPPLMSPASSALSSPYRTNKQHDLLSERRQQQQSEISRAAGRGIMNMLKRDGFLNESVERKNNIVTAAGDGRLTNGYKHYDTADQTINNGSADSAYYTVGRQNNKHLTNDSHATGSFGVLNEFNRSNAFRNPYSNRQPRQSDTVSRKTPGHTLQIAEDDASSSLHDLEQSEKIAENLSATQARIKQQINDGVELERQQRHAAAVAEARSTTYGDRNGLGTTLHAEPFGSKVLPTSDTGNNGKAGVIKLTKPIYDATVKIRSSNPVASSAATAAARRAANIYAPHPLSDVSLKEKYLPKPQCLINHNLEWQESTQKLLLREYLDEHNELFTVIACCGPQSSGKSTILSCLGIQSLGDFHLFDHDAHLIAPAQRQTSSINVYINAKQRVILLDSPGILSTQILAELLTRPTRPPPLYNGDKINNIAGVHVYLEHQAEVYAYQMAAFLFAVSHVVLFCSDRSPVEYYQWIGAFLLKTCIMKPPALNVDTESPLCGVVDVDEMIARQRLEERNSGKRSFGGKLESTSSYMLSRGGGKRSGLPRPVAMRNVPVQRSRKMLTGDHWPNVYFVVNKARDDETSLKLCSIPDDRIKLEMALKALVSATPLGRSTRFTDRLRLSAAGGGARGDEEKWPKLAYEDCQLFVVPFIGKNNNNVSTTGAEEQYNPALRFILDDDLAVRYYGNNVQNLKMDSYITPSTVQKRAGILTGVKLSACQMLSNNANNFRNMQKWSSIPFQPHFTPVHRRLRAGLVVRTPSSHVMRYHFPGGPVEQAFYADLNNAESFIVERQLKSSSSSSSQQPTAEKSGQSGAVTWKDLLANKPAYDTIARLRRTCFNAPSLPITPGVRMSEKQWLRYASAMWSYIKSDAVILNYARAINMASSAASTGT